MAASIPPRPTVQARCLLGWMERDEAIQLLTQECVPPMDLATADALWAEYRSRVLALPDGRVPPFTPLPFTAEEQRHSDAFAAFMATVPQGGLTTDAVKVDLRQLVAQQYYVILDRSEGYRSGTTTEDEWLHRLVPLALPDVPVQIQFALGQPHAPNPMSSIAIIDVPHAEFALIPNAVTGAFTATQFMRHAAIFVENGRAILKAGYHRTVARLRSMPTATVPAAVVARELNVTIGVPNQPAAGVGVMTGTATLGPLGSRAALLTDFITDDLFIEISIRRKKYQLRVHSLWTAVDDI